MFLRRQVIIIYLISYFGRDLHRDTVKISGGPLSAARQPPSCHHPFPYTPLVAASRARVFILLLEVCRCLPLPTRSSQKMMWASVSPLGGPQEVPVRAFGETQLFLKLASPCDSAACPSAATQSGRLLAASKHCLVVPRIREVLRGKQQDYL